MKLKSIAGAVAAASLLVASSHAARTGHAVPQREALTQQVVLTQQVALTQQVVRELASSQYQERAENPTLAVQQQGHNAVILKQRGTGACTKGWRDAVHQSAWLGKLAKCWRLAGTLHVEVCPITAGRIGKQSCIEIQKAMFTTQGRPWPR
jgi:ribulose-5-phosphate 4-epimerase/fuculose-1-phosphate aldolase